jgi:hypothetical protein
MTLKENLTYNNLTSSKLEKIAEEFAIGFAEWLKDKPRSEFTKESLEKYKKEKDL